MQRRDAETTSIPDCSNMAASMSAGTVWSGAGGPEGATAPFLRTGGGAWFGSSFGARLASLKWDMTSATVTAPPFANSSCTLMSLLSIPSYKNGPNGGGGGAVKGVCLGVDSLCTTVVGGGPATSAGTAHSRR